MIIEKIAQLEKRLQELEAKQKSIIARIDELTDLNIVSLEYDAERVEVLLRQLRHTTCKKWGIVEALETLGYRFTYIDNKIRICNEFDELITLPQ